MPFVARTRDQIRQDLLGAWAARYAATGRALATWPGSPPYLLADALAVTVATLETQAEQLTRDALPSTAAGTGLDAHGQVWDVARRGASPATLRFPIAGTAGKTAVLTGHRLVAPSGLQYVPTVATLALTGSTQYLDATCTTVGTAGNLPAGTVCTWDSTPTWLSGATATVVGAPAIPGADQELDAAYATRLLGAIRERPGSGNREDWRQWVEACEGVAEAYVYPCAEPGTVPTPDVPGCVTLVALGPVQGDSTTNTRVLSSARAAQVKGYIEGTHDAAGNVVSGGSQLRPAVLRATDYDVRWARTHTPTSVDAKVTFSGKYPWPWSGTMTVGIGSDTTSMVCTGDETGKRNRPMLVHVGTGVIRGGWQLTTPATAVPGGGGTTVFSDFDPPLLGVPTGTVYPAPPTGWSQFRTSVFAHFDALGPGQIDPGGPSNRYPDEDVMGRATLFLSQLEAVLQSVPGVLSVEMVSPAGNVTPSTGTDEIVVLGELLVRAP